MEYRGFAEGLAKDAGEIMRKNFTLGMKKEWKGDTTPVTETDKKINSVVIDRVREVFPSHNILAEEESLLQNKGGYVWVCDPVDGTIPFSHGMPLSTFSLALVKNGEPILGVIYDPFLDRMCVAEKGEGATLNGNSIAVSSVGLQDSAMSVINVEGWNSEDCMIYRGRIVEALMSAGFDPMSLFSIAYSCLLVAAGEMSGFVFPGTNGHAWDIAAAKIIIEEAGGKVTDIYGNEQRYDESISGAIGSNGIVHDKLIKIVSKGLKQ